MGLVLNTFKTSEGSNNPMHMHSHARAFAVHTLKYFSRPLSYDPIKTTPLFRCACLRNDFIPM